MSKCLLLSCASLVFVVLTRAAGAQSAGSVGSNYWVCQGIPAHSAAYTAIFEGPSDEFPSNVTYAHEFCDYVVTAKAVNRDGLLCDCNVAATKTLAERWLHDNLSDAHQHFEEVRWTPRGAENGAPSGH